MNCLHSRLLLSLLLSVIARRPPCGSAARTGRWPASIVATIHGTAVLILYGGKCGGEYWSTAAAAAAADEAAIAVADDGGPLLLDPSGGADFDAPTAVAALSESSFADGVVGHLSDAAADAWSSSGALLRTPDLEHRSPPTATPSDWLQMQTTSAVKQITRDGDAEAAVAASAESFIYGAIATSVGREDAAGVGDALAVSSRISPLRDDWTLAARLELGVTSPPPSLPSFGLDEHWRMLAVTAEDQPLPPPPIGDAAAVTAAAKAAADATRGTLGGGPPATMVIVFLQRPTEGTELQPFPVQPILALYDTEGNVVTSLHRDSSGLPTIVTATLTRDGGEGVGDSGGRVPAPAAVLLGNATVPLRDGVARFANLGVSHAGSDYRLRFAIAHAPAEAPRLQLYSPLPLAIAGWNLSGSVVLRRRGYGEQLLLDGGHGDGAATLVAVVVNESLQATVAIPALIGWQNATGDNATKQTYGDWQVTLGLLDTATGEEKFDSIWPARADAAIAAVDGRTGVASFANVSFAVAGRYLLIFAASPGCCLVICRRQVARHIVVEIRDEVENKDGAVARSTERVVIDLCAASNCSEPTFLKTAAAAGQEDALAAAVYNVIIRILPSLVRVRGLNVSAAVAGGVGGKTQATTVAVVELACEGGSDAGCSYPLGGALYGSPVVVAWNGGTLLGAAITLLHSSTAVVSPVSKAIAAGLQSSAIVSGSGRRSVSGRTLPPPPLRLMVANSSSANESAEALSAASVAAGGVDGAEQRANTALAIGIPAAALVATIMFG